MTTIAVSEDELHYVKKRFIDTGMEERALCGVIHIWHRRNGDHDEHRAICPECLRRYSALPK